jgi:glyceraldehyde-3-phosphate dehydrogenase/erythrose-4-phosphate dehydrogenase
VIRQALDELGDNLCRRGIVASQITANVVAWYDNEWGYSVRFADLAHYITVKK